MVIVHTPVNASQMHKNTKTHGERRTCSGTFCAAALCDPQITTLKGCQVAFCSKWPSNDETILEDDLPHLFSIGPFFVTINDTVIPL